MRVGASPARRAAAARDHIAGRDEGFEAGLAGLQPLLADLREGIDVELVVGEDDEVLEMLGIGAGVVIEPAQRVVDAGGAKQRQRLGRARLELERAVGDRIVHGGEIRHVERIAQRSRDGRILAGADGGFDVDVAAIGEVDRDRLGGLADLDGNAVVLDQQTDLLGEIGAEQIRPRHAGLVHAGPGDEAIGETRIQPRMRRGGDADEGIIGPHPRRDRLAVRHRPRTGRAGIWCCARRFLRDGRRRGRRR